ncbi:hypothetical protein PG993_011302 [Apiospora rasikravindrae]|uniref:Uncharacterized protein n=1 Tax=Apiospora rasikravindrae TaxID=990691 RepID=A0ABR1SDT2_9PEZI
MVASPTFAKGLSLSSGFPDIGDPEPSSLKADTALPEELEQTTIQQDTPEEGKSVETGNPEYASDAPVSEQAAESTSLFSADTGDSVFTTDVPALETAAESTSLFSVERESQEIAETRDQAPDPWAFADFSCFETPAPQPIQEQPAKSPIADRPIGLPVPVANKLQTIPEMPSPATVTLGPVQSSKKEEQEGMSQAVENIIQNLPDLSYMLR